MGKVIEIGKSDKANGMSHLMEQASGRKEKAEDSTIYSFPKNKCLKVRCILANIEYYVPDGNAGVDDKYPPYYPFTIPLGYSVVNVGSNAVKSVPVILRHESMRLYQTGISTEICDLPEWWDRRDSVVG